MEGWEDPRRWLRLRLPLKLAQDQYAAKGVGVELAGSELAVARDELGLDVRASLDQVEDTDFDIVCLFEVIEHIAEPVEFVRKVASYLRPGGILCVATDNFNSGVVSSMGKRFPKWIPHQHISLFDEKSLPLLIEKAGGLETIWTGSFTPWELLAQSALFKMSGGRRGGREFTLAAEIGSENSRPYPLFRLRKHLNKEWVRFSSNKSLSGENDDDRGASADLIHR